jgi:plasmid stability protein
MRTLYLRNVPDEVGERLERMAAREGLSVSALAVRELSVASRRADNPALLLLRIVPRPGRVMLTSCRRTVRSTCS